MIFRSRLRFLVFVLVPSQMAGEPRVSWIAEQLAGLGLDTTPAPSGLRLAPGDRVIARFSVDGQVITVVEDRW